MADVSNKTVALLLVVVIAVSLGGMLLTLSSMSNMSTGFAVFSNQTGGYTNFSINSTLSITFSQASVDFGLGQVNQSHSNCNLTTNGTPISTLACLGFTTTGLGNLTIENNGNEQVNVSLNMSANASMFIGNAPVFPGASFQYKVVNPTVRPGCNNLLRSTMAEVNSTTVSIAGQKVCTGLNSSDTGDRIVVPLFITLPWNTPTGAHKVIISAIGCDDSSC
jgi:hypothetical protein